MTSERTRILESLSPPELLLYVAGGGKRVTRAMEVSYANAVAWLGRRVVPSAEEMAAVLAERAPQRKVKPPTPLFYRPPQGMHRRTRKSGRKARAAA